MAKNYWTAVYAPMTKAHYRAGGFYRVVNWIKDEAGKITGQKIGKRLTLRQALAYRGDIEIIFGSKHARR